MFNINKINMKKLIIAIALGAALMSCEEKSKSEKMKDDLKEVGSEMKEGAEEVGDEIEDAADDLKKE
jgi:gas vesicle protein